MEVKHSFLVETCLLTHGLRSIADDENTLRLARRFKLHNLG